jgi:hypothetical protein
MLREQNELREINTSHCVSEPGRKKKGDHLHVCDSCMVMTAKIEVRYNGIAEAR